MALSGCVKDGKITCSRKKVLRVEHA
jgi:hypothetical protein